MTAAHLGPILNFAVQAKGQLISKANCQAVNSSQKRTNEFVFTNMRCVFVPFLEEIEDSKKAFRNYLTISWQLQSSHTDNHTANVYRQTTDKLMLKSVRDHPFKTSACLRGGGVSPCADGQKVTVHNDQKSDS